MKIAYIILAHKNSQQLAMLVNQLKEDWCDIFLHLDEKCNFNQNDLLKLLEFPDIYFTKNRYSIDWGGYSMIDATYELFALVKQISVDKNEKYDRIILLSGQCFPICSNNKIYEFFEINQDKEFLWLSSTDKKSSFYRRIDHIGLHSWSHSENKIKNVLARIIKNIPRNNPLNLEYCYGSQWFNITNEFFEYLLALKADKNKILEFFKFSRIPDESMFNIILMNSQYKNNLVNDNLRYIEWSPNEPSPHILKTDDIDKIIASNKLFARKFDIEEDGNILELIKKRIN